MSGQEKQLERPDPISKTNLAALADQQIDFVSIELRSLVWLTPDMPACIVLQVQSKSMIFWNEIRPSDKLNQIFNEFLMSRNESAPQHSGF